MIQVGLMRAIDRYAGIPLCWFTGIWRSIFPGRQSSHAVRTIMVTKFFGMGSIILATPLLASLRAAMPSARIVFVSFGVNRELLERLPYGLDVRTISTESALSFFRDTVSLLLFLRRMSVDAVCDLEFFSKFSTLVAVLCGAPTRIGYELPTVWRRLNLTHPVPLDRDVHVTNIFLRQLAVLQIPIDEHPIVHLEASGAEVASMERRLGLSEEVEVFTVNINAGRTSLERRWDPANFAAVMETLLREDPVRRCFLIGNGAEQEYNESLLNAHPHLRPHVANCAGKLTIGELIALLQRSIAIITNDSGPMHITAAVGTPIVALFGPESPEFYGPRNTARVLYSGVACSPCLNVYDAKIFVCPFNARCMKEIQVADVLNAIRSLRPAKQHAHA